jgi:hypothetical protein
VAPDAKPRLAAQLRAAGIPQLPSPTALPALLLLYRRSSVSKPGHFAAVAGEQHVRLARAAGRFEGCDRHLLGLKLAAITSGEKARPPPPLVLIGHAASGEKARPALSQRCRPSAAFAHAPSRCA